MKILFLVIILISTGLAQFDAPSGYTTNYNLRKWSQGARAGADSINANWDLVDAIVKARQDTIDNTIGKYWKANTWGATNTFSAGVSIVGQLTLAGAISHRGQTIDTTASRTWVRDNLPTIGGYVDLTSTQTIGGAKFFSTALSFGSSGIFILPQTLGSLGTNSMAYSGGWVTWRGAGTGVTDTLISFRNLRDSINNLITNSNLTFTGFTSFPDTVNIQNVIQIGNAAGNNGSIDFWYNTFGPLMSYKTKLAKADETNGTIYLPNMYGSTDTLMHRDDLKTGGLDARLGDVVITGDTRFDGMVRNTPQVVTSTGDFAATSSLILIALKSTGEVEFITGAVNGETITIINTTTDNYTILGNVWGAPSGSVLGSNIVLGQGDSATLVYYGANEQWIPIAVRDN